MVYPNVNLNGTSKRELLDQLNEAYIAIDAAINAVYAAMPNARDYTPQGSAEGLAKHTKAVEAMLDRARRIRSVKEELQIIAEHIELNGGR